MYRGRDPPERVFDTIPMTFIVEAGPRVRMTKPWLEFARRFEGQREVGSSNLWVLKAVSPSQKEDVMVLRQLPAIQAALERRRGEWAIQRCVDRPLCVHGHKTSFHGLVLITDNLEVFLWRELRARLAPHAFRPSSPSARPTSPPTATAPPSPPPSRLVHVTSPSETEPNDAKETFFSLSTLSFVMDAEFEGNLRANGTRAPVERTPSTWEQGYNATSDSQGSSKAGPFSSPSHPRPSEAIVSRLFPALRRQVADSMAAVMPSLRRAREECHGSTPRGFALLRVDWVVSDDWRPWLLGWHSPTEWTLPSQEATESYQRMIRETLSLAVDPLYPVHGNESSHTSPRASPSASPSSRSPLAAQSGANWDGFELVYSPPAEGHVASSVPEEPHSVRLPPPLPPADGGQGSPETSSPLPRSPVPPRPARKAPPPPVHLQQQQEVAEGEEGEEEGEEDKVAIAPPRRPRNDSLQKARSLLQQLRKAQAQGAVIAPDLIDWVEKVLPVAERGGQDSLQEVAPVTSHVQSSPGRGRSRSPAKRAAVDVGARSPKKSPSTPHPHPWRSGTHPGPFPAKEARPAVGLSRAGKPIPAASTPRKAGEKRQFRSHRARIRAARSRVDTGRRRAGGSPSPSQSRVSDTRSDVLQQHRLITSNHITENGDHDRWGGSVGLVSRGDSFPEAPQTPRRPGTSMHEEEEDNNVGSSFADPSVFSPAATASTSPSRAPPAASPETISHLESQLRTLLDEVAVQRTLLSRTEASVSAKSSYLEEQGAIMRARLAAMEALTRRAESVPRAWIATRREQESDRPHYQEELSESRPATTNGSRRSSLPPPFPARDPLSMVDDTVEIQLPPSRGSTPDRAPVTPGSRNRWQEAAKKARDHGEAGSERVFASPKRSLMDAKPTRLLEPEELEYQVRKWLYRIGHDAEVWIEVPFGDDPSDPPFYFRPTDRATCWERPRGPRIRVLTQQEAERQLGSLVT